MQEADCRAMGGARPIESEVDESSEDDMYVDESSEDDEDDEEEDDEAQGRGASRHRLEWDNDIWKIEMWQCPKDCDGISAETESGVLA